MQYLALILFGLIESMVLYTLFIAFSKGHIPALHPTGRRVRREINPLSYWLYVSVFIAVALFIPFMAYTTASLLSP